MQNNREGLLIVISGPSGVGKGTICKIILERNKNAKLSVSATTRQKRQDDIEGVNYFFKTKEEFERMIENNEFLEYMQVFGMNYYGTPRAFVDEERRNGHDIILEIDVKGAKKVKELCPDAVLIFIAPPTMSDIKTRLLGRGTESQSVIERRFNEAFFEIGHMEQYDYIVVNDVIEKASKAILDIIEAEKCRTSRNDELVKRFKEVIESYDESSAGK